MLGPLPFLLLGGLFVVVLVIVAVRFWRTVRPGVVGDELPGLVRLRRIAVLSRVLGLVAGVAMPFLLAGAGRLGQGLALVPTVVAAVLVLSGLAAEGLGWGDARGGSAALEVRRVRDYLPLPTGIATLAALVVLVAAASWTTEVAGPDDVGRPGRSFAYRCLPGSGCDSGSFGPFPGSFYTVPVLAGLVVLLALALVALVVAVRRPRNGADPAVHRVDEQIRRSSVRTVVAAVLLAAAGTLTGIGFFGANGLLSNWSELSAGPRTAGVLLQVAGVVGLALSVWAVADLLRPLVARAPLAEPALSRPVGR